MLYSAQKIGPLKVMPLYRKKDGFDCVMINTLARLSLSDIKMGDSYSHHNGPLYHKNAFADVTITTNITL